MQTTSTFAVLAALILPSAAAHAQSQCPPSSTATTFDVLGTGTPIPCTMTLLQLCGGLSQLGGGSSSGPVAFDVEFDVAVTFSATAAPTALAAVTYRAGGESHSAVFSPSAAHPVQRYHFLERFQGADPTNQGLVISNLGSGGGGVARVYLGNVSVRPIAGPAFHFFSARYVGAPATPRVFGQPGSPVLVALSHRPCAQTPIQVPGLIGGLQLDPQRLYLLPGLMGVLDARGVWMNLRYDLPAVPSLVGVPLYWQAMDASGFGSCSMQALHS